ncbi:MAG: uridine diphosphate-N-acetylglucosamine-binding protein YvcK [Anaeromyxobacter sp.]
MTPAGALPAWPGPTAARPLRVAAVGGGTGLPRVLSGLAPGLEPEQGRAVQVTALVSTADDGGSSGALRRAYGVPAPGDARRCLEALAAGASPLASLFEHRFEGEGALAGHTVGNVILTALAQRLGDFDAALDAAARLLGARGRVVPAVEGLAQLVAVLEDGREVRGESAIAAARGRVARLGLARPAPAPRRALAAVLEADLVVMGPGSLFSSVLAGLLGTGMAAALRTTRALRVLVVNLRTEPGETEGCDAAAHVAALQRQLGDVVDAAVIQHPAAPAQVGGVAAVAAAVEAMGVVPVLLDLEAPGRPGRHDPQRLARVLLDLARMREG